MQKLFITALIFVFGLWIWSEYFRAIPHLEQVGVLKNFNVELLEPYQAEYRVLDKKYYSPNRRMLHPAAPMVGSFNDLTYLSNIDVLLVQPNISDAELSQFKIEQTSRCFDLEAKHGSADLNKIRLHIENFSVIASSDAVAKQIRQLKANQRIQLKGHWVNVRSAKTNKGFHVGFGSPNSAQCRLFQVSYIAQLN